MGPQLEQLGPEFLRSRSAAPNLLLADAALHQPPPHPSGRRPPGHQLLVLRLVVRGRRGQHLPGHGALRGVRWVRGDAVEAVLGGRAAAAHADGKRAGAGRGETLAVVAVLAGAAGIVLWVGVGGQQDRVRFHGLPAVLVKIRKS